MDILEQLKPIDLSLAALPEICPSFQMPKLSEKPQNPIMDSIQFWNRRNTTHLPIIKVDGLEPLVVHEGLERMKPLELPDKSLWDEAHARGRIENTIMSWDTLCHHTATNAPVFLSERSDYTLAAARYIVLPTFQNESVRVVNVMPSELFECVKMTLSGISSPLHVWDSTGESFLLRGLSHGETGKLVVSVLDEITSQSLVQRFLTIGTIVRRLEILISKLQDITSDNRKHLHAFGHSLSSVLSSVKAALSQVVRSTPTPVNQNDIHALNSLWSACAETAEQLEDLAALCSRVISLKPDQYPALSATSHELLSTIYKHLESLFEKHAARSVTATCAFVLTSTSADYLGRICYAVGYSHQSSAATRTGQPERLASGLFDDDLQESEGVVADGDAELDESFPCFFTPEFSEAIVRARRSLKLLQTAKSDHPLLVHTGDRPPVRWFWSDSDVQQAWLGDESAHSDVYRSNGSSPIPGDHSSSATAGPEASPYGTAMQAFKFFDLEPGTHASSTAGSSSNLTNPFATFLKDFPPHLPSLTPTLETLRDLVLLPLAAHIESLSAALQDTFLSKSSGHLDFRRHLTLLRSYLLLTSYSFKTRLESALFCDAPEPVSTESSARTMAVRASRSLSRRRTPETTADSWVIGLAPTLTEGRSWPPGGSDLSFYLRTVIIDSLEADYHHEGDRQDSENDFTKDLLLEEAEWRLGFAIRDLHVGTRSRWLNPQSMEAMDFLYMDYHAPHPLDVLIPPGTLSKYYRVFAFNLRLMRVENVMKALFRMTQHNTSPLFETIAPSRRLFLYFRFVASSFVSSLSSYVYDTAIGGNFDPFLHNLASPHDRTAENPLPIFSDVFALADHHSKVMDDILSACLLRSSQKAVGDLLRGALEIILEFGILMSDLRNGKLQEYEAAGSLDDIFSAFCRKMVSFHKALKEMVNKSTALSDATSEDPDIHILSGSLPAVAASLHDLLTRTNIPESWQSSQPIP